MKWYWEITKSPHLVFGIIKFSNLIKILRVLFTSIVNFIWITWPYPHDAAHTVSEQKTNFSVHFGLNKNVAASSPSPRLFSAFACNQIFLNKAARSKGLQLEQWPHGNGIRSGRAEAWWNGHNGNSGYSIIHFHVEIIEMSNPFVSFAIRPMTLRKSFSFVRPRNEEAAHPLQTTQRNQIKFPPFRLSAKPIFFAAYAWLAYSVTIFHAS